MFTAWLRDSRTCGLLFCRAHSAKREAEMESVRDGLLIRAAEYVRMSTDHQRYSTANQSDAIQAYAMQHGMAIVRTYSDAGKSGLSINRRNALKQLLDDVQTGRADFRTILVYDVSRWGRFQEQMRPRKWGAKKHRKRTH
jgi:DNA invertase Pin-like site-specific DNA recombinase